MGTRHLIAVQVDGKYKVAQYGQWDGYPSGQGIEVLRFLHEVEVPNFYDQVSKLEWIPESIHQSLWIQAGADPGDPWVNCEISDRFRSMYPELSRDTCAGVLQIIADGQVKHGLVNAIDFAYESLFCEWAYVIDLDKGTFEIYEGFNSKLLDESERFYKAEPDEDGYYGVKLTQKYPLWNLPTEHEFLAWAKRAEEELEAEED